MSRRPVSPAEGAASGVPQTGPLGAVLAEQAEEAIQPEPPWHVLTGEYPPQPGGVAAYTQLLARALAADGTPVHVWCPTWAQGSAPEEGVTLHRLPGGFSLSGLRRLGRALDAFPSPRRLLVQWVPHGFGYKAMNLPFTLWLWARSRAARDEVYVMAHEAHVAFGESWKTDIIAFANRMMDVALLQAADRIWVGTPEWAERLAPYRLGRSLGFDWLPVPSNIPRIADDAASRALREEYAAGGKRLLGHFGTYGWRIGPLLDEVLPHLLERDDIVMMLLGHGAVDFRRRFLERYPSLEARLIAPVNLGDTALSLHLAACELFVQPYPDGLTCRRGSAMAVVGHGVPLVSNKGRYTEPIWTSEGAALVVPTSGGMAELARAALELLDFAEGLERLRQGAERLYRDRFDLRHTVAAMRGAGHAQRRSRSDA